MRIFVLGDSFADNLFVEAYDWIDKSKNDKTFLWNEIVVKPISILDYKKVQKY